MLSISRGVLNQPPNGSRDDRAAFAVIVRGNGVRLAFAVSAMDGQRELVTRPLPQNVGQEAAVSGAAVLSNGDIVLLADCDALTVNTNPALSVAERVAALGAAV